MEELKLNPAWEERIASNHQREDDHRTAFERDRARILHSSSFRRLQAKTQIHAVGESDFARTRLTHSLETAQIGSSLVSHLALHNPKLKPLLPSSPLIEGLCLAHDIGHPPFGHGGENALNFMMYQDGGFEGNAQTFRILSKLEPYTKHYGMNLTRRTLLGVIKYPVIIHELAEALQQQVQAEHNHAYVNMDQMKSLVQKGIYKEDQATFDWVLEPLNSADKAKFTQQIQYKSLDCSIMELADDIAYGVHDLEDAIERQMVTLNHWQQEWQTLQQQNCQLSPWFTENLRELSQKLFSGQNFLRKQAIGALVNHFISQSTWRKISEFNEPLLVYNIVLPETVAGELGFLKKFVYNYVISCTHTQRREHKGQYILRKLFQILSTNPERLLPTDTAKRWKNADKNLKNRIICDYIAGMTDNYALKIFQELSD